MSTAAERLSAAPGNCSSSRKPEIEALYGLFSACARGLYFTFYVGLAYQTEASNDTILSIHVDAPECE